MKTLAINITTKLAINDATQQIRMCAERFGLPLILIVQAGPGLPLLHEVTKFQRRLNLEKNFTVCYWDQRGCGIALRHDATNVSLPQQVDDLRAILRWLNNETKQTIIVFGISLGATIALQTAENEPDIVKAIIAISPDANIARSDAAAASFLKEQSAIASNGRLGAKLMKLGELPYINSATFQLRASMLADIATAISIVEFIFRPTTFIGSRSLYLWGARSSYSSRHRKGIALSHFNSTRYRKVVKKRRSHGAF